jgi:hypothetical protein
VPRHHDHWHLGSNVTVNIQGLPLDDAAVQWMYSESGTSAPVESAVSGVGNSFTYSIAPRTLIVLLIPSALSGDFNRDGAVDAADFAVWRHMLDQNVVNGAGADGDGNGRVDQADFAIWLANFGNVTPGQSSSQYGSNNPEPTSRLLLILCCILAISLTRRSIAHGPFESTTKSKSTAAFGNRTWLLETLHNLNVPDAQRTPSFTGKTSNGAEGIRTLDI